MDNNSDLSLPIAEASNALQKQISQQQLPNLQSQLGSQSMRLSKSQDSLSDFDSSAHPSQLNSARGSVHDLSKVSSMQKLPDPQVSNVITPVQMLALVGQMHNKPSGNFAQKLFKILMDNYSCKHLFDWTINGLSFVVYDIKQFEDQVLPKYFKHSKFSSFVRQLNIYGFAKVSKGSRSKTSFTSANDNNVWEFQHPLFQRDHPELLDGVAMKNKSKSIDTTVGNGNHSDSSSQTNSPDFAQIKATLAAQNGQILQLQNQLSRSNVELMQQRKRQIVQQSILKQIYEYTVEPQLKDQMPFDVLERSILNIVEQQMNQQQLELNNQGKRPYPMEQHEVEQRRPFSSQTSQMDNILKSTLRNSSSEGQNISKLASELPVPVSQDLTANNSNSTSMSSIPQMNSRIKATAIPSLATSPMSPLANLQYSTTAQQQHASQRAPGKKNE